MEELRELAARIVADNEAFLAGQDGSVGACVRKKPGLNGTDRMRPS
jgi:hypothetical protein